MYTVTKYPQGTFSWSDGASTDPEKAKDFYVGLLGWGKEEIPMGDGSTYTMFKLDGADVAGFGGMQDEMKAQGVPSHWNSYITVDDVDSMVEKVKANGGTVIAPPFDVFDSGRMMVIQDPTGATVSLWEAKNHIGAGVVNKPGAMLWNELSTRDLEKAKDFFNKILGWEYTVDENNYTMILNNGRMNGGMMQMDESWGDMPPNWMIYFNIDDLDAAIAKVDGLGGKVIMGKTSAGAVGEFAIVSDPAGGTFTIMEANETDKWEE